MLGANQSKLIHHIHTQTIPAAYSLLPAKMMSNEATAMLIAIGLIESEFNARIQGGRGMKVGKGPAHGFWQFERLGGCAEILSRKETSHIIIPICEMFLIKPEARSVWDAIVYHDVLAACFARLLLWIDPRLMPKMNEVQKGWRIYLANWRPGKPHPKRWPARFNRAWDIIREESFLMNSLIGEGI